ncbi:hypothetical protein ACFYVK_17025 [Streptomyces chartreusis]|uniref:effector-associated constant component EACC1 n=1 Tax=Streptomyces chartreusis TaxID=1969 RepID=UPI0036B9D452
MGPLPLIAEVGSVVVSLIAASSFGAAIKAWYESRVKDPKESRGKGRTVTVRLERDGQTVELSMDDMKDQEELQKILAELMDGSDVPEGGESEEKPPRDT